MKCHTMWQFISVCTVCYGKIISSGTKIHPHSEVLTYDLFNLLPTSVVCWKLLQTVWTQIRPDKLSCLVWTQTVFDTDCIPEIIFLKSWFWKKISRRQNKKHAKLPSRQRVKYTIDKQPLLCQSVWKKSIRMQRVKAISHFYHFSLRWQKLYIVFAYWTAIGLKF